MSTTPWLQTASGRAFDLINPTADMVDFRQDVPDALARIPRFNGHVPGGPYSVAQHCCIGADAILDETGRADLAAAFLLHDAHEAYIGDIATPVARALAVMAGIGDGVGADIIAHKAFERLKMRIDRAIFQAACLPWPSLGTDVLAIKRMDLAMLEAERRQLLGPSPAPWGLETEPPRLRRGALTIWPWIRAADEWRARLIRLCPQAIH
ncbi:hypothetical protein [Chelatococcus asaccharovorans]|uniref:hypothetical protein n=1 Tax=Chelatococcus asaccharovorans TaxID=28210 RepID=UPI00224C6D2A|nr:hypothetical protein [Chelatococcus asaccharovorans]CAH1671855.1 conserved hypothetical protein [Chelatococcus asaccharovorans]CAH1676733.1 conserved hypothetical protein [Chelatococcus asaccharovorans]